ncbi:AI-2E family transporter [Noviherbaspirillum sedimenti]|nr:AI-2E family transporter [Noviherbaspirillum sedimenti]
MQKNERLIERIVAVTAMVALIGGCLYILAPFFAPLLWAAIISFCTWPIYIRLVRLMRGQHIVPALIMVLLALLCGVGPLAFALFGLAQQTDEVRAIVNKLIERGVPPLPDWIAGLPLVGARILAFWNDLMHGGAEFADFVRNRLAAPLGQWLLTLGAATGAGLLQLALSIIFSFFFYIGGYVALEWLLGGVRRIAGERGPYLLQLAGGTVKGVVYGILGTALVQAVLAGLGYWLAGVPGAAIWLLATFFLSVIPMAPALIWIPATIWLYSQGALGWAIFLVVWNALVVGSVDNVIKPLMISKGGGLPFIVVLLGVLGGAIAFGFLGVFIGPTMLAVGYSVLHDWTVGAQRRIEIS